MLRILPDSMLGDNDDYQRWLFEVQRAEWEAEQRELDKEEQNVETLAVQKEDDESARCHEGSYGTFSESRTGRQGDSMASGGYCYRGRSGYDPSLTFPYLSFYAGQISGPG